MPCPGRSLDETQMPGVPGGSECACPAALFKAHCPLGFLWLPCPPLSPLLAQTPSASAVDASSPSGRLARLCEELGVSRRNAPSGR